MRKKTFAVSALVAALTAIFISAPVQTSAALFQAPSDSVLPSSSFQAPITVSEVETMSTFQFSLGWESTVLEYTSVSSLLPGLTFDASSAASGQANVTWVSPSGNPAGFGEDHLLFTINFNVIGSPNDTSAIAFTSVPVPRLATSGGTGLAFNQTDGLITVVPEPVNVALAIFGSIGAVTFAARRIVPKLKAKS